MAYNRVILEGRITNDVELRTTQSGVEFCNFTMAVDRNFKNGEERLADFPTLKAWRGTAKFISQYFHKGDPILVDGRLETSKFEGDDGRTVYRTDVVVDNATFTIGKKNADNDSNRPYVGGGRKANDVEMQTFTPVDDQDGDLPF